ncbi:hypothetical protein H0H93_005891 [Arthromyces matolae]|nr:hypothetical protein H0H93_005891 [Arthromyces matolae]
MAEVAALKAQLTIKHVAREELSKKNTQLAVDLKKAHEDIHQGQNGQNGDVSLAEELLEHIKVIEGELCEGKEKIQQLEDQLKQSAAFNNTSGSDNVLDGLIIRPKGTAGQNFSIQDAMGLGKTTKDTEFYKSIQRQLQDLALRAHLK